MTKMHLVVWVPNEDEVFTNDDDHFDRLTEWGERITKDADCPVFFEVEEEEQ